jgi:hypothetical protein
MPDRDRAFLGLRGCTRQDGTTMTGNRQGTGFLLIMVGYLLLAPLIAESWEILEGGKVYVCY